MKGEHEMYESQQRGRAIELRSKLEGAGVGVENIILTGDTFFVDAILEGPVFVRGTEQSVLEQLGVSPPQPGGPSDGK